MRNARYTVAMLLAASLLPTIEAPAQLQGVIVTINNTSGARSTFQTPVWVGFHDGSFDIYDQGSPASAALERLAEDGTVEPISDDFATMVPDGVQSTITSNDPNLPPLANGNRVTRLFKLDPAQNKYFSYASMVIPSNDAFVANGDPVEHPIFDDQGNFIGERFDVLGEEVLDAGTELNDELPENTAFFGQMMPNTGITEGGVVALHPGFLPPVAGGILADPMFENADFLQDGFRNMLVRFKTFDVNSSNRFQGLITSDQEVPEPELDGIPFGVALTRTNPENNQLTYLIFVRGLTGEPAAAHLHLGRQGRNGPVVVDLLDSGMIFGFQGHFFIFGNIDAGNISGPLASGDSPFDNLLAELASRGIYVNIHTEAHPGGEIRGQLR